MEERTKCLRYTRVVGYIRPLNTWNEGKQAEFLDRKVFEVEKYDRSEEV
jgi:ribonucleoside-triphosphate reductase